MDLSLSEIFLFLISLDLFTYQLHFFTAQTKMARLAKKVTKSKAASASAVGKKPRLSTATTSSTSRTAASQLLATDLNAFLHQDKESKKQKRDDKRASFLNKIGADGSSSTGASLAPDSYKHTTVTENNPRPGATTIHDLPGRISKSAERRRKRKAKSAVLASVADLSSALPESFTTTKATASTTPTTAYKTSTKNVASNARPPTAKMTQRVVQHEMAKFSQTMASSGFQKSPFEALRASINASLVTVNKPEKTKPKKGEAMEL